MSPQYLPCDKFKKQKDDVLAVLKHLRAIIAEENICMIEKKSLNVTRANFTLGTNRSKASIVSSRVVHHFAVCILITVGHVIRRLGIADAADSV